MSEIADFELLMREHGAAVYSLAVRLCGNEADGQDVAQETFIKAYRSRAQFRGEAQVQTWLHRICVNVWKNRVRYEKRRFFWRHFSLSASRPGEASPVLDLPDLAPSAPEEMARLERHAMLHQALA